ncbi:Ig-like domain-containing protein [Paenibacillus oenotherae]|uniref:Ig-like domain-containing protein n=1 Tax=Paenibacillus oenotherae TaxID=1435645 RepID=A0ABS7D590_9BACL|nr:Ig-like domain-containing protein [Paenibacillus oenotherae]MBW7475021.1 Ig-like domain-containing protein [Paenibacillus oenotherae]
MNQLQLAVKNRLMRSWLASMLAIALTLSAFSGIAFAEDTVTGIEFETIPSPAKLFVDDETIVLKLNAIIQGTTSRKDVTQDAVWASTNSSIVKVDKGTLTAVSNGSAQISAQYKGFKVTLNVTSEYKYDSIAITASGADAPESADLELGATPEYGLTATKDGADTTVTSGVEWTSSNAEVATVSSGKVKLISAGEATITAKYKGRSDTIKLKVTSPYKSVTIQTPANTDKLVEFKVGDSSASLSATALSKAGISTSITNDAAWTTSNAGIATVDKGILTPVGTGTATITAFHLGASDTITVVVRPAYEAMRITPKEEQHWTLKDAAVQFKVEVLNAPDYVEDVTSLATWTSSNVYTATVNANGLVTPKGIGTTMIKAAYKGLTKEVSITVYPTVSSLTAAKNELDAFIDETITMPKISAKSLAEETVDVSSLVRWTSSNEAVVALKDGKWTAKAAGTSQMKAVIQNHEVTVTINVHEKPVLLTAAQENLSVVIGTETKLPTITMTSETGKETDVTDKITWKSSSPYLLINAPNVKGLRSANATLTASYLGKSTTIKVSIEEEITKVFVEAASITLNPGRTKSIKVTGIYKSGKSVALGSKMNWTINPETLATINGSTIKGLAEGTGKLTGTYQKKTVEIVIVVKQKIKKLDISDKTLALKPGDVKTLKVTALYEGGRIEDVTKSATWTSSNAKAATVAGGVITVIGKGSATIKAVFEGKTVTMRVSAK